MNPAVQAILLLVGGGAAMTVCATAWRGGWSRRGGSLGRWRRR